MLRSSGNEASEPIGDDHPLRIERVAAAGHRRAVGKRNDLLDSRLLSHFHSELARPREERFRELHAAHAEPVALAEARFRDAPVIDVPDPVEGTAPLDAHAHGVEKPHTPRHQALAARLVDGKAPPLEDGGIEPVRCGENGGRKPRGTASHNR